MKYVKTTYGGVVEFLAADAFTAIPGHITGDEAVLAGTPISAAGAAVTDVASAAGILLYDVDPAKNPNCALLVKGIVDLTKMNTHSGLSLTAAAIKAALPGIVCRENIGVND